VQFRQDLSLERYQAHKVKIPAFYLVVCTALGVLLTFSPLTSVLHIDSALVVVVVLVPLTAMLGVAWERRQTFSLPSSLAFALLGYLQVLLIIVSAHFIKGAKCPILSGVAFFILGPPISIMLACVSGALIGQKFARRIVAYGVCSLLFILDIGLGLYEFYASPNIDVFGHLWGYYPGALYDWYVKVKPAYLYFRLLTLSLIAGLLVLYYRRAHCLPSKALLATSLLLMLPAAAGFIYGERFGFRSSPRTLVTHLGQQLRGPRCTVVLPKEVTADQAKLYLEDCEFHIASVGKQLDLKSTRHVTAYFFRSPREKRELMGAFSTYIAKPWRSEVYLQLEPWPHPVLRHELTHALASVIVKSPFGVPGHFRNLVPVPGLIEGLATAMDWEAVDGLNAHQWARILMLKKLTKGPSQILGGSFFLQASNRAYTVAGSFLRYLWQKYGAARLCDLYAHADFVRTYQQTLPQLEGEWLQFLQTVPLPASWDVKARARFSARPIFDVPCARYIAEQNVALRESWQLGQSERYLDHCNKVAEILDAHHPQQLYRIRLSSASSEIEQTLKIGHKLTGSSQQDPSVRSRALEYIGDTFYRTGNTQEAASHYQQAKKLAAEPAASRRLFIKQYALRQTLALREGIMNLVLDSFRTPEQYEHWLDALESSTPPPDAVLHYILGKAQFDRHRYAQALDHLVLARSLGLVDSEVRAENLRHIGMSAYTQKRFHEAAEAWNSLKNSDPYSAHQEEALQWFERLAYAQKQ